ncbi:MAG: GNAT family N-acetyltransferase [Pedobacter sp.]
MSADHVQIEQIRYELTWRIRHEVMYPHLPLETIKLPEDPEGIHFGLYAGDHLTSVISVFNQGNTYQFRKLATLEASQSKGYGTMLLSYVIAYVTQEGGEKIWCNARTAALRFYEKLGFKPSGDYFSKHGIDFVIMELQLGNATVA